MSECVVRMEVPENCYECDMFMSMFVNDCPIYQKPGGQGQKHKYTSSRHPDCPIICSLPEGHGRLVDIDRKFLRVANNGHGMSWNWRGSIADMIDKDNMRGVEIIVPAERSEE